MILASQARMTTTKGAFTIVHEADIAFVAGRLTRDNGGRVAPYRASG